MVLPSNTVDYAFYGVVGGMGLVVIVVVSIGTLRAMRMLQLFEAKNAPIIRGLAIHALTTGILLLLVLIALLISILVPLNSTFESFAYVRTLVFGLLLLSLRVLLMVYFRMRTRSRTPAPSM